MIRVLHGDCRDVLKTLSDASVHCCVTSPPYWGLRDYGVDKQIGLEATPEEYVSTIVDVFREVRRVLRDDGTLWLNLGDSYSYHPGQRKTTDKIGDKQGTNAGSMTTGSRAVAGLKPKDLVGIPWMVAFALRADGWWLRQDNVWAKRNCMPESVTDRTTRAHEYLFHLTKSPQYFYDSIAIEEDGEIGAGTRAAKGANGRSSIKEVNGRPPEYWNYTGKRNKRSVWWVATQPYKDAHFATFPPDLIEPCILAGTSERGCCANCGAPWVRVTKRSAMPRDMSRPQARRAVELFEAAQLTPAHVEAIRACGVTDAGKATVTQIGFGKNTDEMLRLADEAKAALGGYHREFLLTSIATVGWQPSCQCKVLSGTQAERGEVGTTPCVVLDPFAGAGTTGLVADRHGRDAILIDLNPNYGVMSRDRLVADAPLFVQIAEAAE